MSSKTEWVIWSRNTGQCMDNLSWQLSINLNMDVQYQRWTYGNGIGFKFIGRADVRTHVQTKYLRSVGYQTFKGMEPRSGDFGERKLRYKSLSSG